MMLYYNMSISCHTLIPYGLCPSMQLIFLDNSNFNSCCTLTENITFWVLLRTIKTILASSYLKYLSKWTTNLVWKCKQITHRNHSILSRLCKQQINLSAYFSENLDGGDSLKELILIQEQFMADNFPSALLILGAVGAGVHYEQLVKLYGGCQS